MEPMEAAASVALRPVPVVELVQESTSPPVEVGVDLGTARRLLDAFLASKSPRTVRAYAGDLRGFALFLEAPSPAEALRRLLSRGHGEANGLALDYRNALVARGLAPSTVNRRLAALRSAAKLARLLGTVSWSLEVEGVRSRTYRDTRGPGVDAFRRMVALLEERAKDGSVGASRDLASLRLLFDLGLRRSEVVELDVAHLDLEGERLSVLGKGRTEREFLTLPRPTERALRRWLLVRDEALGAPDGPLFVALDRSTRGVKRLSGRSLYQRVRCLGEEVGVEARPHGLRHSAITRALDATNGDVRAVQRFSRHRDLRTVLLYDDNRADMGGEVARLVAGESE